MKTNKIRFHPEAERELDSATEWYHQRSEVIRKRFEEDVKNKIGIIIKYPERYPKRHGHFHEAVVPEFPYLVVYRYNQSKKIITIVSVFHTSRNPKYKYKR